MGTSSRAAVWATWSGRIALLAFVLWAVGTMTGCNPAAAGYLMQMFGDDKVPAKCKLSRPNADTTVAIVTWFGNTDLQLYPELMPTDNELSEKLGAILRDRFSLNNEKVKVVPNAQIRAYQNKITTKLWSPADLGKKVKADFVIALEIKSLTLHEKSSFNTLYRGTTEIAVNVYDLSKPEGEQVIFDEIYQRSYPKDNPLDATGSAMQFRALFLRHVTRELSRWFAAYSHDELSHNMEQD